MQNIQNKFIIFNFILLINAVSFTVKSGQDIVLLYYEGDVSL